MNNIANTTTLWQLLGNAPVVIPILQRDYAQGRSGQENLREKFLLSILNALNHKQQLKLDFVYGSSDLSGRFNPLDGQQRLTTLWLIHWYIAYKLGKLSDPAVVHRLSNFSYETRSSSTQFCRQIVERGAEVKQKHEENIADAIMRQTWIPSIWRQDPTIQAMLRMLSGERNEKIDGIEELFCETDEATLISYWESLMLPANNCPLVFYQLDLENLGQSDDLYVKMNGRGKPLSDYENFKADLVKYMTDKGWISLIDPTNGLPILLDTIWLDFFWKYRNESIDLDDILFGFLNRYFLVRLMMTETKQKIEDKDLGNAPLDKSFRFLYSYTEDKDKRECYSQHGFGVYLSLFDAIGGLSSLNDLRTILNNINKFTREELSDCIRYPYDYTEKFELVYTSGTEGQKQNLYKQTIPEIIAFWAVCRFFQSPEDCCTSDNLRHWMRIVWNVCNYHVIENNNSVAEIRSKTAMRSAMLALEEAFSTVYDVYNLENLKEMKISSAESEQRVIQHILEEQEKVRQFAQGTYSGALPDLQNKSWEEIITEEEHLPIFEGTIRALIYDDKGSADWSQFDAKYSHLHWYLQNDRLNSIAYRNYLLQDISLIRTYFWFPEGVKRDAYWRLLLAYKKESTHRWLMAHPNSVTDLSSKNLETVQIESTYANRSIIKTNLLDDFTLDSGMYLTHSWTNGYEVFIHHQASSPYIIFNEERDNVLNSEDVKKLITLDPAIVKKGDLFNARDIKFNYRGEDYLWTSAGFLYKQSNPEIRIKQPSSYSSLLNVLIILNCH